MIDALHIIASWLTFAFAVFGWMVAGVGYAWSTKRVGRIVLRNAVVCSLIGIAVTLFALTL